MMILILVMLSQTHAATLAGADLPDNRGTMELHGAGLLRKGLFFKIYVGALYLEEPADGLTYAYGDATVITIECDAFANAYFSVWLGDEPSSRSVKSAMLEDLGTP